MTPVYKTSDDQEHATEQEAQEHQELLDAFEAHKEARKAYAILLSRTLNRYFERRAAEDRGGADWRRIWAHELYDPRDAAAAELLERLAVWTAGQVRRMGQHGAAEDFAAIAAALGRIGGSDP